MKILLVDDIPPILRAIEEELDKRGHQVTTAEDGQEALDLVTGGLEFDLVITDQNMPRLTGAELIRRLRELGYQQPMLVLTSVPSSVPEGAGQTDVYDKRLVGQLLADWNL